MVRHLPEHEVIREVEQEFSVFFPYLKLQLIEPVEIGSIINERNPLAVSAVFELAGISNLATPVQLARSFNTVFNMKAEIYRKEYDQWVRITDSDISLKEENEIGRATGRGEAASFEDIPQV